MTGPETGVDADALRAAMAQTASRLTRTLAGSGGEDAALQSIVVGALQAIPAAAGASITLLDRRGAITTHAPSTELVAEIDQVQAQIGEGPCIDAARDEEGPQSGVTDADDLATDPPWPRFAEKALAAGMHAVLSFQLVTGSSAGALNLYSTTAHGFAPADHLIGGLFADQAAVALAGARRVDHLSQALRTRDVIGQAKGILMERFRLDDPQAFEMLVSASQDTNLKLHDVAEWMVRESRERYAQEAPDQ
ncbi:GAF and ANTAR domain-containing protein [Pseudonocardia endophytica]|uniref:GAF domain-containing protein n=1 Tax=Pseudonocardia endophytica TaxID=401976 RepID=A0A4R1HR56_PSEEN|nr:GAF and ANTAR domain-containing protein [Pseudonocardia endophytica]TCK24628.1 GAF domain-containing protein [Pseudonocardia endophytica]